MAGQNGPGPRAVALLEALRKAPERFGFFQALRRLECAFSDRPRLGESRRPSEDPVRLGQEPTVAFPPSTISALQWGKGEAVPRLVSRFLGLFGPHGPLPMHLTEYARDRLRNVGDATFVRFADMFHHRILSLYYRAFANSEPAVSRDRPDSDRFATYVGAVLGVGMPAFLRRDALPDLARLYYAGRFAAQPKNAEGLRDIISDFFAVPVEIEEFVAEWVKMPDRARWRLGSCALGHSTMLGARTWLCQGKFRIVIGPLDQKRAVSLLPGTKDFKRLEAIVRSYVGDQLAWDVRLIMDEKSRRAWSLGSFSQLGWTTGLGRFVDQQPSIIVRPRQVEDSSCQTLAE